MKKLVEAATAIALVVEGTIFSGFQRKMKNADDTASTSCRGKPSSEYFNFKHQHFHVLLRYQT